MKTLLARTHALSLIALALPFAMLACTSDDDGSAAEELGSSESGLRGHRCSAKRPWCTPAPSPPPPPTTPPPASPPPSTPPPASPPPSTPPPTTSGFHVGQRPFVASSSWNTAVASGASYKQLGWPASTGYNYIVSWDAYSPSIYDGTSADPLVQIETPAGWGYPAQSIAVHLPAGVTGASGTDGEILMIDGTTIHNCWQFKRTGTTTGTCSSYGRVDALTGTGWGTKAPFLSAGIVAAGSSEYAGLLVQAESDAGEIEHALQLVLDGVLQKPNPVGEAISSDGGSSTGIAQEGERLAIPKSVTMPSGLSPLGQKVFRAFQKYGAFDIDVAGGCSTIRVQANAYDAATIAALTKDMGKLIPLLAGVQP